MNRPSTFLSSRLTYARFGPLFFPSFLTSSERAVVRTSDAICASSLLLVRQEFSASEKLRRSGCSRNTPTLGTQVWFVLAVTTERCNVLLAGGAYVVLNEVHDLPPCIVEVLNECSYKLQILNAFLESTGTTLLQQGRQTCELTYSESCKETRACESMIEENLALFSKLLNLQISWNVVPFWCKCSCLWH